MKFLIVSEKDLDASCVSFFDMFEVAHANLPLAIVTNATILACSAPSYASEASASHALMRLTDYLEVLNRIAPAGQQLRNLNTVLDTNRTPGSIQSIPSSANQQLRMPNCQKKLNRSSLVRWKNKLDPADFEVALKENTEKLKVWTPFKYGSVPYVIGGCVGGRIFQWLKLSPVGDSILAERISDQFDLRTTAGVAKLLHSVVQLHRLLQKLQNLLP